MATATWEQEEFHRSDNSRSPFADLLRRYAAEHGTSKTGAFNHRPNPESQYEPHHQSGSDLGLRTLIMDMEALIKEASFESFLGPLHKPITHLRVALSDYTEAAPATGLFSRAKKSIASLFGIRNKAVQRSLYSIAAGLHDSAIHHENYLAAFGRRSVMLDELIAKNSLLSPVPDSSERAYHVKIIDSISELGDIPEDSIFRSMITKAQYRALELDNLLANEPAPSLESMLQLQHQAASVLLANWEDYGFGKQYGKRGTLSGVADKSLKALVHFTSTLLDVQPGIYTKARAEDVIAGVYGLKDGLAKTLVGVVQRYHGKDVELSQLKQEVLDESYKFIEAKTKFSIAATYNLGRHSLDEIASDYNVDSQHVLRALREVDDSSSSQKVNWRVKDSAAWNLDSYRLYNSLTDAEKIEIAQSYACAYKDETTGKQKAAFNRKVIAARYNISEKTLDQALHYVKDNALFEFQWRKDSGIRAAAYHIEPIRLAAQDVTVPIETQPLPENTVSVATQQNKEAVPYLTGLAKDSVSFLYHAIADEAASMMHGFDRNLTLFTKLVTEASIAFFVSAMYKN